MTESKLFKDLDKKTNEKKMKAISKDWNKDN